MRTWKSKVNVFLAATNFYRRKFIEGGFPSDKILVQPHFLYPDPGMRPDDRQGDYALFIGRLDPEKGIRTLLKAWQRLPEIPLKIRGGGRLAKEVNQWIEGNNRTKVDIIGWLSKADLIRLVQEARFLVWPSEGYYETFGYAAVESYGCGIPVIASRIGVQEEMIADGITGFHFQPGNPDDLAEKAAWAWQHPSEMATMGRNARKEFEEKYSAEINYPKLMDIFARTINGRAPRGA
jgi:glycosyltransferase involved in cell wall biosynthesis